MRIGLACAILVACAGLAAQDLDKDVAKYLAAEGKEQRAELLKKLVGANVPLQDVMAAIAKGPTRPEEPKKGWVTFKAGEAPVVLWVPDDYDATKKYTLLVDLHGGVSRPRFIPVEGLKRRGGLYGDVCKEQGWLMMLPAARKGCVWWEPAGTRNVVEAVRWVIRRYNVDPDRVYLTGFSDGASGAIHMCAHNPTPFAAFVPLNGNPLVANMAGAVFAQNMRSRPTYAVNTTTDPLYPSERMKPLMEVFKKAGADLTWRSIEGHGHRPSYMPDEAPHIVEFIKKHVRTLPKKIIWLTDDVEKRGRCDWLVIEKMGECGEPFEVPNCEVKSKKALLGVQIGPDGKVVRVVEGYTADKLGLKAGDKIVEVDGRKIESRGDIAAAIKGKKSGDETKVIVERMGEQVELSGKWSLPAPRKAFPMPEKYCGVELSVEGNRVNVRAYNVARYRLLLAEPLFAPGAEIEVYTNGRLSFKGVPRPDVGLMLRYAAEDLSPSRIFWGGVVVEVPQKEREKQDEGAEREK